MNNNREDSDRRKGIIWTASVHVALLIVFLIFGLPYTEPKPENGIAINFGNSETGLGSEADGAEQAVESQPKSSSPEQTSNDEAENPTMTQDIQDAASIDSKSSAESQTPEPTEPEEPTPSNKLSNMLENVRNSKQGGEGVKEGSGDQGDPDGDINSQNRVGDGGGGGNGNYRLGNRKALTTPNPVYKCPDEGRVVVKIYVDRNGKVTSAIPGEKIPGGTASTTTSKCLYERAKAAALNTTWQADGDAPNPQIGYIIYNFSKN